MRSAHLPRLPLPAAPAALAGLAFLLAAGPASGQPALGQGSGGAVLYVDAEAAPGGDGASWASAFRDLQDALAVAQAGDEVWIAEGSYRPTTGSDRTATFALRSGVALYGGFDGTETHRDERDWTAHRSILSGDVGVPGDSTDNAYHVVTASGVNTTAVLDGLTVQHGQANSGLLPHDRGAGLYAPDGSPTIRNARFLWNRAAGAGVQRGGGIYVEGGSPVIEDTAFEGNVGGGAGLYASGGAPVLRRVVFRSNGGTGAVRFADGSAGVVEDTLFELNRAQAVYIEASSPVFRRTTFRDNVLPLSGAGIIGAGVHIIEGAPRFEDCLFERLRTNFDLTLEGGGVYVNKEFEPARPVFLRSTFRDNTASGGAAAYVEDSEALFLYCRFERNRALSGGALHLRRAGSAVVASTFVGNRADPGTMSGTGGAISVSDHPAVGGPLIASVLFAGNAARHGGAVSLAGSGTLRATLVNVTMAGNAASETGGAVRVLNAQGARLANAVLWGNAAPVGREIRVSGGGAPVVERAIVAGGCPAGVTCTTVLDQDPLFVRAPSPGPDQTWGTADDDYGDLRVQPDSPALDFGLTSLLPPDIWDLDGDGDTAEPLPLDVAGQARTQGVETDLGAYEHATSAVTIHAQSTGGLLIIPAGGGAFPFRVVLTNHGSEAQAVAAGTAVVLPNGTRYGPLHEWTVVVPGGASVTAALVQRVPGSAPAGLYRYEVYTGTFEATEQVDMFGFLKESAPEPAAHGAASGEAAWGVEAWEVDEGSPSPFDGPAADALRVAITPNPSRDHATLALTLGSPAHVRLALYDVLGRRVALLHEGALPAGSHAFALDGHRLPAGTYLVRAETETAVVLRRLTRVR